MQANGSMIKNSMKYTLNLYLIIFFTTPLIGSYTITFFIEPYGMNKVSKDPFSLLTKLGKMNTKLLKRYLNPYFATGVFSSYWGYLTLPSLDGQVTFPRKQAKDAIKLLVTKKIIPIFMIGTTIHHWELDPTAPFKLISLTRQQDSATKTFAWHIESIEKPENSVIDLNTIIIFAHPDNIVVPQESVATTSSPNLLLPTIYAKSSTNIAAQAFWLLNIKQFFGNITTDVKESGTYFSRHVR